jgi:hypothetical protein
VPRADQPTQREVLADRFSRVPWRRAIREAFRDHAGNGATALPERLEGAVCGHLVGDALGVPYEFTSARPPDEVEWRGHGSHGQPAGTWSDDGALTLALLDSLLGAGFDPADQGRRARRRRPAPSRRGSRARALPGR